MLNFNEAKMKNSNQITYFAKALITLIFFNNVYIFSQDSLKFPFDEKKIKSLIETKRLSTGAPTIAIYGSMNYFGLNQFGKSFQPNESFKIKLGYSMLKRFEKILMESQFSGIDFEMTNLILNEKLEKDIIVDLINFGVSLDRNYGYNYDNIFISSNKNFGIFWTEMDYSEKSNILPLDNLISSYPKFSKYLDETKFGKLTADGISITFYKKFNMHFNYELLNIYPAYLFWKQTGSIMIEFAAWALIEEFIKEIEKTSPELAPIMSLALNAGFSRAYFEIRKNKMAWPFKSREPLNIRKVTIGISYIF